MTTSLKHLISSLIPVACAFGFASCSPGLPENYTRTAAEPKLYPDYSGITVPCNIAPLNCRIDEDGESFRAHFYTDANAEGIVVDGQAIDIPVEPWHRLLADADTVFADIYVEKDGAWTRYATIRNAVADSIDPYISYRLIEPSYISFETMAICQRNLENFDEHEIYNSQALSAEDEGQCINCHSYQGYNRAGNMQMHVRVRNGGTVIAHDGTIKKVNLKTPETLSAGVYPSWHPTEPLIAYSLNTTTQSFHSKDINKIEVQDAASDLILYDVANDRISIIAADSTELETFPYWHPDGRSLWYVSASVPAMTAEEMGLYQNSNYEDFKYDLYRREFDPVTRTFGAVDTVLCASGYGKSATLPRPSPDGKYLLFTMGAFGTFHIWHRDSDLYLADLTSGAIRPMDELNSDNVESYHSWSSNGRWIIFSTRRDDGSYTRLYLSHFRPDGTASKPFRLPQSSPSHDEDLMKSYNIPEFMVCPVPLSKRELVSAIKHEPVNVTLDK